MFTLSFITGKMSKEFSKVNHESHFKRMQRRKVNAVILHLDALRIQKSSVAAILRLSATSWVQVHFGALSLHLGVKQLRLGTKSH